MDIQSEIKSLIDRSNIEYLKKFLIFTKSRVSSSSYIEIHNEFEKFNSQSQVKYTTKDSRQCIHVYKRGNNIGKQCNTILKDTEHIFCSKHRTIEANLKITENLKQSIDKTIINEVIDEIVDENTDELLIGDDLEDEDDEEKEITKEDNDIKIQCLDPYNSSCLEEDTEDTLEYSEQENDDHEEEELDEW